MRDVLSTEPRSVFRLAIKLDAYLQEIGSAAGRDELGDPTPDSTRIIVNLHPQTDGEIWKLLTACRGWVKKQGATLTIEELQGGEVL